MRSAPPLALALASVFVWVACDTQQPTALDDLDPSFQLTDATTSEAHPGFYFLPPLVSQPSFDGTFLGDLPVSVVLYRTVKECNPGNPDDCWMDPSEEMYVFPTEEVEVDTNGQHYQVNWHTDLMDEGSNPITPPGTYRIEVTLATKQIGFVDVEIVENGSGFKNLTEGVGEIVGLPDGRTLPVKFRIEYGVLANPGLDEVWDISFQSDRDGDFDIFLMDLESGVQVNLTADHSGLDGTANWHPTEDKIVFASDRDRPGQHPLLYTMTMTPEGLDVQQLGTEPIEGWQPEYSPDGSMIVFQRGWPPEPCWGDPSCTDDGDPNDPTGREHDIWVMDENGSNQVQLTDVGSSPNDYYEDFSPTWHPTLPWVTFGRSRNALPVGPGPDCHKPDGMDWNTWLGEPVNPISFCHFDVVSVDVSQPSLPWIRHTFNTNGDHLAPKWSPEGVLTLKRNADDGLLVAFPQPATTVNDWPPNSPISFTFLTPWWFDPSSGRVGLEDGDVSWSSATDRVLFGSMRSGEIGIFLVDNWYSWLNSGDPPAFPQVPLVVGEGVRNDWARWRPGH